LSFREILIITSNLVLTARLSPAALHAHPRRILKEVSVLLEALEKRQLALETENKQLREDLAGAANMIEEADAARLILEQLLSERDMELVEKRDGVYDSSE
jgi:ppGpp synthetase/RelA/SpoT-type nucleotidyltranferase